MQTKVGTWNTLDRLGSARAEEESADGGVVDPMANKTFVICGVLVSRNNDILYYWLQLFSHI